MSSLLARLLASPAQWRILPGSLRAGYALLVKRAFGVFKRPLVANIAGLGSMKLEPWDLIDSRIYFFGEWEPAISKYMREAIRPGAVVADIGANIGYYTLLMSRAVGPAGRVYAAEPSPEIRARLEDSLARNAIANVTVIPFGISDRSERRSLRRLADVIPPEDFARLSFIKIDVEGMEAPVMRDISTELDQLPRELTICAELRINPEMQQLLERFRTAAL